MDCIYGKIIGAKWNSYNKSIRQQWSNIKQEGFFWKFRQYLSFLDGEDEFQDSKNFWVKLNPIQQLHMRQTMKYFDTKKIILDIHTLYQFLGLRSRIEEIEFTQRFY